MIAVLSWQRNVSMTHKELKLWRWLRWWCRWWWWWWRCRQWQWQYFKKYIVHCVSKWNKSKKIIYYHNIVKRYDFNDVWNELNLKDADDDVWVMLVASQVLRYKSPHLLEEYLNWVRSLRVFKPCRNCLNNKLVEWWHCR